MIVSLHNTKPSKALDQWLNNREFEQHETDEHLVETAVSRGRFVYMFRLACINRDVVMKVSTINPTHPWNRKLELFLKHWIGRDHNKKAFVACCALRKLGIAAPTPIAFWRTGKGMRTKTYFMYEKINKSTNGEKLLRALKASENPHLRECADALLSNMCATIRRIHDLGWRHGDSEAKNFLLDAPAPPNELRPHLV